MKKTLLLVLLASCLSCKKADSGPNAKTAMGSIEATANGKAWPDLSETIQVSSGMPTRAYLEEFPCAKDVLTVQVASFTKPLGYVRAVYAFQLPFKVGDHVPLKYVPGMTRASICVRLPFSSILSFSTADGDVLETGYLLDDDSTNRITVSSITANQVVRSFDLHFVRSIGFGSTKYPDDRVHLVCKQFVSQRLYEQ
jgi:hypothetical protein